MDLSENIKKYRKRAGLTQAEVAEKMGIASPNYTLLENGKTEMTISKAEKLAEVFEVSVGELLGLDGVGKVRESTEFETLKKENERLQKELSLHETIKMYSEKDAVMIGNTIRECLNDLLKYCLQLKDNIFFDVPTPIEDDGTPKFLSSIEEFSFSPIKKYVFQDIVDFKLVDNYFFDKLKLRFFWEKGVFKDAETIERYENYKKNTLEKDIDFLRCYQKIANEYLLKNKTKDVFYRAKELIKAREEAKNQIFR